VSLENTVLFSTFTSYSHKVQNFYIVSNSAVGSLLAYGVADPYSIPK
jgi:hypothetical protein